MISDHACLMQPDKYIWRPTVPLTEGTHDALTQIAARETAKIGLRVTPTQICRRALEEYVKHDAAARKRTKKK